MLWSVGHLVQLFAFLVKQKWHEGIEALVKMATTKVILLQIHEPEPFAEVISLLIEILEQDPKLLQMFLDLIEKDQAQGKSDLFVYYLVIKARMNPEACEEFIPLIEKVEFEDMPMTKKNFLRAFDLVFSTQEH